MFDWLRSLFETKEQRVARLKAEAAEKTRQAFLAKLEAEKEAAEEKRQQELAAAREKKARKELSDKIKQAKAFAKEKKLKRTRRNGQTVYVNSDGDIVNYAILYYLLFHTNNETYGREADYTTSTMQQAKEHASDFVGSFGGGESGGGGASSSWSPDVSSGSSWDSGSSGSDFGSFGGGDSGGGGASDSW